MDLGPSLLYADRIETLLALLRVGQEARFFEFLGNPILFELRKPLEVIS